MKGLRTQENEKFIKYFEMVQNEARKRECTFFCDCGLGDVLANDSIECESMCGWLIPEQHVAEFETIFQQNLEKQHDFDAFYCSVNFSVDEKSKNINIDIDDTPDDLIVDDFNILQNETKIKQ